MATKRTKADPTDDFDSLFEGITDSGKKAPTTAKKTVASKASAADTDILAELENELQPATSRPHTPRPNKDGGAAARRSDDKQGAASAGRKSTDSSRSLRASFTPSATSSELQGGEKKAAVAAAAAAVAEAGEQAQAQTQAEGGGWWGSIFTHASAAMKTAEAAVKDLQQHEEAKKWADQVRGNVGALRGFGDELRHRALPTFTNILHTLAPPISSHERLHIHITHDLTGYPSLDPMIHSVFSRVMSQVEGGDLLVIQRGRENTARRSGPEPPAWRDGPWWRSTSPARDMGVVKGLVEGTKLCRANAEGYAAEYFSTRGGLEEARRLATEPLSSSNPVRTSDLFLSVQAVGVSDDPAAQLFARASAEEKAEEDSVVQSHRDADERVLFAIFILDPVHEIEYSALSQALPARWARWLDAPPPLTPTSEEAGDDDDESEDGVVSASTPEEIREIIESGGVDPREWVAEWVEETLSLSVGIVAQRYVARRMGVGEGGIGKGKKRMEEVVGEGGGEAARAGLI
ncbi:related to D.melanogaster troponin T and human nucleolin [Cephalotrichum gorgonifer]|uniref:Related to D.melanogaster troponin T and human nucleolin n=1 Tax=Cephalotrichum gorgonifer TaxID=2041049 RepID=A0AAE8SVJ2_9PEZI|nr:related to D.melanogaster troponin T and human nucleolin [Cephalotrichum gorgonifer]